MAVPPAPDGQAVGDPSDSTDTASTDSSTEATADGSLAARRPLWLLVALFAVVLGCLLACLVALGRAGWSVDDLVDEQTNPQTQRDKVMAAAQSFATVVFKYGPEDLDEQGQMPGYVERVEKLLTAKFATTFEQNVTFAEQTVAQQQVTRTAQVFAVGVSRLEDDSARVLVAGTDRVAIPDPDEPEQLLPYSEQTFRYEVDLVLTQGEWLVDDFGPVGTLDQPDPEDLPTAPSPEGTQGSQGVRRSDPEPLRPAGRRRDRLDRGDPGRLEGRDRRPRPQRPALPGLQPGRRDAARPRAPRGVRRRAGRRAPRRGGAAARPRAGARAGAGAGARAGARARARAGA